MDKNIVLKFIERKASLQEQQQVMEWIEESPENRKEFAALKNMSVAADILAIEQLARKRKIRRIATWSARAAAAIIIVISTFLLGEAAHEHKWEKAAAEQFTQITAPQGQTVHFNLPDGSKVILNSGSTLKFSKLFNEQQRDVYLSGEGYFEVKKDEKSFNVAYPADSPIFKLSVLGTTFNISSYPDNNKVVTSLYSGSVQIEEIATKELFMLEPNNMHIYEVSTGKSVIEPITESYRWTDKYVVANDEDILEFAKRLEKIFNVRISIERSLIGNCSYTGALYGGSLQQILDNMSFVSPIKYTIQDNGTHVIINHK